MLWKNCMMLSFLLLLSVFEGACGDSDRRILEFEPESEFVQIQESSKMQTQDCEETKALQTETETEPELQPEPILRMTNEERVALFTEGGYVANVEERTIVIPGLVGTYYFLYLSDMHILVQNEEVAEADKEYVKIRAEEFASNGKTSAEIFDHIVESANAADLDGVLMGGDMIDFLSDANAARLNEGLAKLEIPYMYVTADHDLECWWTEYSDEEREALRAKLNFEDVEVMDCGEFLIVGVSDSTSQLTEGALEQIERLMSLGRPVLLIQHVPMDFGMDEELREYSRQNWDDRVLLWGDDTHYHANRVTQVYLDLVNSQDSPVVAVLAGHLHFRHECMLNGRMKQYIFYPAYSGEIALITVQGSAEPAVGGMSGE